VEWLNSYTYKLPYLCFYSNVYPSWLLRVVKIRHFVRCQRWHLTTSSFSQVFVARGRDITYTWLLSSSAVTSLTISCAGCCRPKATVLSILKIILYSLDCLMSRPILVISYYFLLAYLMSPPMVICYYFVTVYCNINITSPFYFVH